MKVVRAETKEKQIKVLEILELEGYRIIYEQFISRHRKVIL